MKGYRRAVQPKPERPTHDNEIRITSRGRIRNYVNYATALFQEKEEEKKIILNAMGNAISKAVDIAEIIKKRVPGLHQDISTSSTTITDIYEPIEEGLILLEMTRHLSLIEIVLSKIELNKDSPGLIAPTVEQAKGEDQQEKQNTQSIIPCRDVGEDDVGAQRQGRGLGRGKGKGRGRGRGRGEFDNYQGGRYERGRGGGRGRGRGRGYVYAIVKGDSKQE